MDKLVPNKAKRAAGEPRQAIHRHRPVVGQDILDHLEPVAHLPRRLASGTANDHIRLPHLAALDPLHYVADLADHPARIAPHE